MRLSLKCFVVCSTAAFSGLFAIAASNPSVARGDVSYLVTADTSSIAGISGVLDMQFNGEWPNTFQGITSYSPDGAATISNFQSDATWNTDYADYPDPWNPPASGDVSGTPLTGMVMNQNSADGGGGTEFDLLGTFGQNLSFVVTFSGPMFDTVQPANNNMIYNGPNTFNFDFLDQNTGNTLETGNEFDTEFINVDAGGGITTGGDDTGVTFAVTTVPEPNSIVLTTLGLGAAAGMVLLRRRRQMALARVEKPNAHG